MLARAKARLPRAFDNFGKNHGNLSSHTGMPKKEKPGTITPGFFCIWGEHRCSPLVIDVLVGCSMGSPFFHGREGTRFLGRLSSNPYLLAFIAKSLVTSSHVSDPSPACRW